MEEAAVAIIVKDGLILSISRRNDKTKYGLIGGKRDHNDGSIIQTACREVKEECGLFFFKDKCQPLCSNLVLAQDIGGVSFEVFCFYIKEYMGELIESDEGHLKWLTVKDLISPETAAFPQYNLGAIITLQALHKGLKLQ